MSLSVLPDDGNESRLLTRATISTINENQQRIVQLLATDDDLFAEMSSCACFTAWQLLELRSCDSPPARNKKLIKMLMHGTTEQFELFVDCVRKTQRHVVPLLNGNAGISVELYSLC